MFRPRFEASTSLERYHYASVLNVAIGFIFCKEYINTKTVFGRLKY
jgi:hypothetical protein